MGTLFIVEDEVTTRARPDDAPNGWLGISAAPIGRSLHANIPTIVLSGSTGSTLAAGATHQLPKPVYVEKLLALVNHYC
jgi:hypothetical protein